MVWEDRAYNHDRERGYSGPRFIFPMPSRLTFGLLISCAVIFLLQRVTGTFGEQLEHYGKLDLRELLALKQPWRWISYQYLHGSGGHLFWNLLFIYFFVPPLERVWGWKQTLAFYTLGGIAAGVTFGIMGLFTPLAGLIGASGSLFAVLGAITAIMPNMRVLAMLIIPITMRTLTLLYTVLFVFTVVGDKDPSDAAHLGGLAFGFFAAKFGMGLLHRLGWDNRGYESDALMGGAGSEFSTAYETVPPKPRRRSRWAAKRALKLARAERQEQERIDQILAKVSAHGMHSLTWLERRALRKATEHQRERDVELSKLRHR